MQNGTSFEAGITRSGLLPEANIDDYPLLTLSAAERAAVPPFDKSACDVACARGGGIVIRDAATGEKRTVNELRGVTLRVQHHRALWPESSGEGKSRPRCVSTDGEHGQGDPGGSCDTCSFAAWTEDADGRPVRPPCASRRWVMLLEPGTMFPLLIDVAPSSTRAVDIFALKNAPIWSVETAWSVAEQSGGSRTWAVLRPRVIGRFSAALRAKFAGGDPLSPPSVSTALPAPAPAAPASARPPVMEDGDAEDLDEPETEVTFD